MGRLLVNPVALNTVIATSARALGWTAGKRYPIIESSNRQEILDFYALPLEERMAGRHRAYEQPDFEKTFNVDGVPKKVFLEVQLGKYTFASRDNLHKSKFFHKYEYSDLSIGLSVMKSVQKEMSTGPGFFEKALGETLNGDINHPLILLGME